MIKYYTNKTNGDHKIYLFFMQLIIKIMDKITEKQVSRVENQVEFQKGYKEKKKLNILSGEACRGSRWETCCPSQKTII